MASSTYDSVAAVRAAIGAGRRRAARRVHLPCPAARARSGGVVRGIGTSCAIAGGHVAFVLAMRWLLAAG